MMVQTGPQATWSERAADVNPISAGEENGSQFSDPDVLGVTASQYQGIGARLIGHLQVHTVQVNTVPNSYQGTSFLYSTHDFSYLSEFEIISDYNLVVNVHPKSTITGSVV